ncbi:MAG: aminotransferase class III-fold pyridoxal phosphate-dependent enzyme [Candidatus Omnitrophica bacterium]|nr:aminotransferase class III-fold pyridoxal phosphate-dependent enzyme [Candidatus Omnitrophota bacterium]
MTRPPSRQRTQSEALWDRAKKVIPAGTQTFSKGPGQFVNGVAPKYLRRGEGAHVWDVDGNEFLDYGLALGPVILGYAYPRVNEAIMAQLRDGISFTLMHPLEVELSELLTSIIPCAEMVRFGKNGSDATAAAVRLARAFTGRERVACCGYHGWQDWYIGSTSRRAGVPRAVQALTHPFQYNDLDSLSAIFTTYPKEMAAVILEPTTVVEPAQGFLEGVRDLAHQHGALVIFDEVITGFRLALGGAQEFFGVTPDLATFGKAMANGMPCSALVGRADVMRLLDEVFVSFTFAGETLSLAAALATIRELQTQPVLPHLWELGRRLKTGYTELVAARSLQAMTRCSGYPCWPTLAFEAFRGIPASTLQSLFFQEVVKRGILTRPGMFLCFAHTREDIERTLQVYGEALDVLARACERGTAGEWLEGDIIEPVIRMETSPQTVVHGMS